MKSGKMAGKLQSLVATIQQTRHHGQYIENIPPTAARRLLRCYSIKMQPMVIYGR
ncbi:hypothetical protein HF324_09720 [Chitinophaga oryzae]|uniref:Uncharacterized protein n=1 Tax=Chitinophaga oryzae TaxID=2725414 RepID=A0AAE7D6E3_9BACT|nr:hypothetical protein [Chitinophaga oryzae]QJB31635.1 hypothetical protein HF329_10060 [Chitinophaga oryzae]QJB38119.1 hypothetical protein HF324_09720 [Chitinophaga oryzae]